MLQIQKQVYTISEITKIIKDALIFLNDIWVEGEVSNLSRPVSGHIYFTLKDKGTQIRCAIFRSDVLYLRFMPKNGDKVILHGNINVYERGGQYQIVGDEIERAGFGPLQQALERLKERLAAEGLFDEFFKKPLPKTPECIGVITSATGAAVRDIINIIRRRFPMVSILIYPVLVQGEDAAEEVAKAIDDLNKIGDLDVLIVGRGGGSIEDLWAFNEEVVARSIYSSDIPVVSAVGHQIDYTISDFVADVRAPTPSAAAELVVPDKEDIYRQLSALCERMRTAFQNSLYTKGERFKNCQRRLSIERQLDAIRQLQQNVDSLNLRAERAISNQVSQHQNLLAIKHERLLHLSPHANIRELRQKLETLEQRCLAQIHRLLERKKSDWKALIAKLNALNPLAILDRGYSICSDSSQNAVKDAQQVNQGDRVSVKLAKGELICDVVESSNK